MKNLQVLKQWNNSEVKQMQEQQNLKIQEVYQEMKMIQESYQIEKKSLIDSNQLVLNKCKKEIGGLKVKLKESLNKTKVFKIISLILLMIVIAITVWLLKTKTEISSLEKENKKMKNYIEKYINGDS